MKKVILLLCSIILSVKTAFANACFVAKEKDQVLKSEGDCATLYAPESTFKLESMEEFMEKGTVKKELMKNLLHLVKLSWHVKSNIQECLKFDETSEEYRLAKYYKDFLNGLEEEKMTTEQFDTLIAEIKMHQSKFLDRKELSSLFSAINDFLNHLKSMKG